MSSVEEKIRSLGQKKEIEQLREYMNSLETDTLTELVSRKIHNQSFFSFFNYLLEAFDDSSDSHDKRFQLVVSVVKHSQVQTVSAAQFKNIVCILCAELRKFKTEHLIEICSLCVEYIQKGNSTEQSWNDLLPVLLHIIMEREHVEYNGNDYTGFEYKTQLIQSLLMMEWSPNIITPLANMFITVPLTKEEHAQVVNKLGQAMEKLIPLEIPAFVYQLMNLCKNQNSRSVFLRLQNYFGLRVYSNIAINNQDSQSMDLIGNASDLHAIQAESTVLFHIYESAVNTNENVNDYLNSLKNLTKSPEFILHPFQLTALLIISTVSFYETKVFEVLKASVFRSYAEEHRKKDSCWFREMVPSNETISKVFLQVISLSIQERPLVLQGLINFSFFILGSTPAFGKEPIFEKIWALGHLIILQVIKKKRTVSHIIIQKLVNCIMTEQNTHQYIECLNILSKKYGLVLLENQSCVIDLMERLIQVPRQSSDEILDGIIPLTKISFTLRDHLILLLRKGLFSRAVSTRQMAVGGFLKLITILKYSNLGALSQSSSSSSSSVSVLTQISLSNTGRGSKSTFTNEALCLEVLSILKRCFIQQTEVKYELYGGLYDAICTNPDLGVPILDLMWWHFSQFYDFDKEATLPIKFSKLFQVKDMEVVLMEPLGKFLYSVGLILTKYLEVEDVDPLVLRFVNAFANLSEKIAQCDLEHLQLNDGTDLLDVMPESQKKLLLLKEAISVNEALIGFNIYSWGEHSENRANTVLQLFKGYNRLMQFGKSLGKSKKEEKGKNATRSSQSHNETTSTRREGGGKKAFKPFATVLDFQCLEKMLSLLYKTTVTWTSTVEANVLRRNVEFNHFTMQTTNNLLQNIKQQKHLTEAKRTAYYNSCKSIAVLLFERCISRFKDFSNFDNTTAVLSVDAFYVLLQIVNNKYKDKWSSFLSFTTSESSDEVNLQGLQDVYKSLFESLDDDTPQDSETVRYYQTIINSLAIIAEQIPLHSNPSLLDWLKQFVMMKNIKNKQICALLVGFTFDMHIRFKTTTTLFRNVALKLNNVLGSVCEEKIEDFEDVSMITETNASSVLVCLCNTMKSMVDDIDWIVFRLRSEFLMITYPGEECIERRRECLKSKERSTCCQICQLVSIMTIIADISVTPGTHSEMVIKNNMNLYMTLTNLTKYFTTRSNKVNVAFQQARFESVLKQTGKKLSPAVYRFILFIEQNQKQAEGHSQNEKKKADANKLKSKVLKETRLIPKMVYEMEQLSKMVIQLTAKTKVDVTKYVGQGTSRDFRIVNLKEAMEDGGNSNINDSTMDESVLDDAGDDSQSETESEAPVAKKSKK